MAAVDESASNAPGFAAPSSQELPGVRASAAGAQGTGAALSGGSGHSKCRKGRFAGTLASAFIGFSLLTPAKDFYLEKLGANATTMGVLFFVISFCTPLQEMLIGRLQNWEALSRCFPLETWGRKAPWIFTHTFLLAAASAVLYLPPSRDPVVLHGWFFVVSITLQWAVSTCIIAFESVRQELYPYNEERAEVEVLCKIACTTGIAYACLPLLVLVAISTVPLRLAASALFFFGVLAFGLQAKPIWLEAKSTSKQEERSLFQSMKETWKNAAFKRLLLVRMGDGLYQGLQTTNLWYYLTYLLQLSGFERSLWVVGIGVCNIIADMAVALFVGRLMNDRRYSYRIQGINVVARSLNIVITVAMLVIPIIVVGNGPHETNFGRAVERAVFVVWTTVNRMCQSPFTFWRVAAQCWVIDEDIQSGTGARREAAFIGVASATQNFSRAFAAAICFLGYGFAGLRPKDCDSLCQGETSCLNPCMEDSIRSQPDVLRWYIRLLYLVGLAAFELLIIYNMSRFPIQGIRLAKLYNKQTLAYGGDVDAGSPAVHMSKLHRNTTMQQVVEAQHGSSIVVMDNDASAGVLHIQKMMSSSSKSKKNTKLSASVIFSPALASIREAAASTIADMSTRPSLTDADGSTATMPPTPALPDGSPRSRGGSPLSRAGIAEAPDDTVQESGPGGKAWVIGREHGDLPMPSAFPRDMVRSTPYLSPQNSPVANGVDSSLRELAIGPRLMTCCIFP